MDKNDTIILKYNKDIAIKNGALSYKLYVFMLSIFALMILISSAIFDYICYKNGLNDDVIKKYTSKIIYMSLFVVVVWIFNIPVWLPAHFAENSIFIRKDKKLYRVRCKKDNVLDREKYIENEKFLNKLVNDLPDYNGDIKIQEYEKYEVLKKNNKNTTIKVEYRKDSKVFNKKIKIYNIYDNYKNL